MNKKNESGIIKEEEIKTIGRDLKTQLAAASGYDLFFLFHGHSPKS